MATRWVEHARILEDGRAEVLWQGKDGVLIRLMSCRSRCRDTAEPAVNRWGLLHKDGVPVIEISLLAQPESGDDLGIFAPVEGYKSNAFHWKDWALRSKLMMVAVMNCPGFSTGDPRDWILVTTHRLLAATFLYLARTPDRPIETAEDINALDSTLLPIRVYDDLSGTGWKDEPDVYRLDQVDSWPTPRVPAKPSQKGEKNAKSLCGLSRLCNGLLYAGVKPDGESLAPTLRRGWPRRSMSWMVRQ